MVPASICVYGQYSQQCDICYQIFILLLHVIFNTECLGNLLFFTIFVGNAVSNAVKIKILFDCLQRIFTMNTKDTWVHYLFESDSDKIQ